MLMGIIGASLKGNIDTIILLGSNGIEKLDTLKKLKQILEDSIIISDICLIIMMESLN